MRTTSQILLFPTLVFVLLVGCSNRPRVGNVDDDDTGAAVDQAPVVVITAPEPGAVLSGLVTVRVQASADAALSSMTLWIDGGMLSEDGELPYDFAWDTTTTQNGDHRLRRSPPTRPATRARTP